MRRETGWCLWVFRVAALLVGAASGIGAAIAQYQGREKVALVLAVASALLGLPSTMAGLRRPWRLQPTGA